ncbi:hypothetical protein Efla_000951 [Eimeria flavescens]
MWDSFSTSARQQATTCLRRTAGAYTLLPTTFRRLARANGLTETRTVRYGHYAGDPLATCPCSGAVRARHLEKTLKDARAELQELNNKYRKAVDGWAEDFDKRRRLEETAATTGSLRNSYVLLQGGLDRLQRENTEPKDVVEGQSLSGSALATEREGTAPASGPSYSRPLNEAKVVVDMLKKELDLSENGQSLTPDSKPNSTGPASTPTRPRGSYMRTAA